MKSNLLKTSGLLIAVLLLFTFKARPQPSPPPPPPLPGDALEFWRLESPPWEGSHKQPALAFTNVTVGPSWDYDGTSLSIGTNVPAYVNLPVFETNRTNITFDSGSLEIWCAPDWTSATDGGAGPGSWATVWDIGSYTRNASIGAWLLTIDPPGSNLVWVAQSGGSNQMLWTGIDFDAGDWHQLVATWSATNSCLYVDGELATNAGPILYQPSATECSNAGFCVGSLSASGTNAGTNQFQGQLQWLSSYAYPLNADDVAADFADVSAYISYFGYNVPGGGIGVGGFHPADGAPDDWPPGDFGTNSSGTNDAGLYSGYYLPSYTITSNYLNYTNFWLSISNNSTNAFVSIQSTLSNLTYEILTNSSLAATNGWGVWQILTASNDITPAPPLALGSNTLFFEGVLVGSTGTNGLPDWWQMQYFGTLNVDPYADPDGDGLCNLDEYLLGTNPTNAYSISSLHKDAQALLLAYTNDPACVYQLSVTSGADTNTVLVTMSPTEVGTNYQIYTHDETDTNDTWIVATNFLGTNTSTTVAICLNGRSLSFIGGYGEDSDGDGLSDGYEVLATLTDPYLPDTGLTGTPDGYKDPDGDGYSNLEEMYNGTNPHVFNTPAGAQGLVADYTDGTNDVTFTWQPAGGAVLGYVISIANSYGAWIPIATNPSTQLCYTLSNTASYSGYDNPGYSAPFAVTALYANASVTNMGQLQFHNDVASLALVHGPGGKPYLLTSAAASNILAYTNLLTWFGGIDYLDYGQYAPTEEYYPYPDYLVTNSIYFPASQFTNGVAELTDIQAPPYTYLFYIPPAYQASYAQLPGEAFGSAVFPQGTFFNIQFLDGTAQMKQNIRFLLRAANYETFGYNFNFYPTDYVYSSYYDVSSPSSFPSASPDYFTPFEDNYFYCNFVFNTNFIDSFGNLTTGAGAWNDLYGYGYNTPYFAFAAATYAASDSQGPISAILSSNITQWVGYYDPGYSLEITDFGAYYSGSLLAMSNYVNIYGLAYDSLKVFLTNVTPATLSPTSEVSGYGYYDGYFGNFYVETAQPELQTVDYYFALLANDYTGELGDPLPGYQDGSFDVTNTTPLILGSVGTPMVIAGYAKQALLNGNPNIYAYLGQYFSNALVMSNGVATTNSGGILSEYGEFFPTVPGEIALQTMPDPDQGNTNGTCVVDIIRLSLDVNHDGTMDETYAGPDNTGYYTAVFNFWANNDYDRWTTDLLDSAPYEDDLESEAQTDCNYMIAGNRAIPCPRDLEDYARLWVSGVSNTLSRLPAGSTVTLNWGDVGSPNTGNPTIDLFQAADADGGIGYLTNLTTASNQINTNLCRYIGRLGPGSNIVLNASTFSNNWAGDHYIFCGVGYGLGVLYLTIADGSGNVLAQSYQTIQIEDIKQMYERWTVGDNDDNKPLINVVPLANATNATDNFSPGMPTAPFTYQYDPTYDTNDTYILYVTGWNMPTWEKDRWAETAYKRLYWQGYQGRFGLFRWPCYLFSLGNLSLFDMSEWQSWKTGQSLENLLARLNGMYPSNVYLYAHSQGNVACGEALRLATNRVVNTYVASQAAVSARAYDNSVLADATNYYGINGSSLQTPDSEGHYYTNGAASYFNGSIGAGKYVNFYNPEDWALMGTVVGWLEDQSVKPDGHVGYAYVTPSLTIPFGYYHQNLGIDHATRSNWPETALLFPGDTYQIFAMCAQSYSLALGAQEDVSGKFAVTNEVDLSAEPVNFENTHVYHDGQFVFDNMTTAPYWQKLLQSFGLNN